MTGVRLLRAIGLLAFAGFAVGATVVLLGRVGTTVLPKDTYTIQADVRDAVALAAAADVRQSGVKIGRVAEIREFGGIIQLKLEIEQRYAPVHRDATTLVRAKSIAEENYLELDPGSPDAGRLPEGGRLPVARNLEATQNDDVFSIFDKQRRGSVRRTLDGVADGLAGRGGRDLNRTIESSTALVEDASPFARTLAQERVHVARLTESFGVVAAALGDRAAAIRSLTRSGRVAAEAVAARDEQLRRTLGALPALLGQGRATAGRLERFSGAATPVMADLRAAIEELVPVADELPAAAAEGRRALAGLQRFARTARPAFDALPQFSRALTAFSPDYARFLRELNPLVGHLEPYWREVSTWFALAGAATDNADNISHVARVLLPISRSSLPGTLPAEVEDAVTRLAGGLDTRGSNAYPAPGAAADPVPYTGKYPRLTAEPVNAK